MKDKAVHACHALCRARILEEMQRRKGGEPQRHLKFVLSVIDGPRFAKYNSPGRSQKYQAATIVMTPTGEEKVFLSVAVAAIPRVAEIILGFPPEDRVGALETAERRFLAAALDYGCTEIAARSRVSVVMRRLRGHLERQRAGEKKLEALLHRLTEPD